MLDYSAYFLPRRPIWPCFNLIVDSSSVLRSTNLVVASSGTLASLHWAHVFAKGIIKVCQLFVRLGHDFRHIVSKPLWLQLSAWGRRKKKGINGGQQQRRGNQCSGEWFKAHANKRQSTCQNCDARLRLSSPSTVCCQNARSNVGQILHAYKIIALCLCYRTCIISFIEAGSIMLQLCAFRWESDRLAAFCCFPTPLRCGCLVRIKDGK